MDKVLQGIPCGCNIDDICVTGRDDEEHLHNLQVILERLQTNGLKCNLEKCEIMKRSMKYLNFIIDEKEIHMTDDAIVAVRDAPRPESRSDKQSFLGLVNHYRRFAPNLSTVAAPLRELLKKDKHWFRSLECKKDFLEVKRLLASETRTLIHYDLIMLLTLVVDASPKGLGAVLSHIMGKEERPVAYASRMRSWAEQNFFSD